MIKLYLFVVLFFALIACELEPPLGVSLVCSERCDQVKVGIFGNDASTLVVLSEEQGRVSYHPPEGEPESGELVPSRLVELSAGEEELVDFVDQDGQFLLLAWADVDSDFSYDYSSSATGEVAVTLNRGSDEIWYVADMAYSPETKYFKVYLSGETTTRMATREEQSGWLLETDMIN